MFKNFLIFSFLCCMLFTFKLTGEQNTHCFIKHYINSTDISLDNEQIILKIEDSTTKLDQIFCDEKGIYLLAPEKNATIGLWTCPNCFYSNPWHWKNCYKCNWPDVK